MNAAATFTRLTRQAARDARESIRREIAQNPQWELDDEMDGDSDFEPPQDEEEAESDFEEDEEEEEEEEEEE